MSSGSSRLWLAKFRRRSKAWWIPDQKQHGGTRIFCFWNHSGIIPKGNENPSCRFFKKWNPITYPLVNIQKTMENHHFQWENPLFLWPFSIAMLVITRGSSPRSTQLVLLPSPETPSGRTTGATDQGVRGGAWSTGKSPIYFDTLFNGKIPYGKMEVLMGKP